MVNLTEGFSRRGTAVDLLVSQVVGDCLDLIPKNT